MSLRRPYQPPSPIRVRHALGQGVSQHRIRVAPRAFHGGRVPAAPVGVRALAAALRPLMRAGQCFGGLTAAALLGMRLPEGTAPLPLHVVSLHEGRAMRRRGVRGRSVRGDREVLIVGDGLPVTTPLDTWCDLAADLDVDDLVAVADGLVCRRDPIAELDELAARVSAHRGRVGAERLRAALPLVRAGTDSWRETVLRLLLVRGGLPEPEVNGEIRLADGTVLHGDLVWRRSKTIVEYEGKQHWEDEVQFAIDLRRIDALLDDGWDHIRVDKHGLGRREPLIARVGRSILRRPAGIA